MFNIPIIVKIICPHCGNTRLKEIRKYPPGKARCFHCGKFIPLNSKVTGTKNIIKNI